MGGHSLCCPGPGPRGPRHAGGFTDFSSCSAKHLPCAGRCSRHGMCSSDAEGQVPALTGEVGSQPVSAVAVVPRPGHCCPAPIGKPVSVSRACWNKCPQTGWLTTEISSSSGSQKFTVNAGRAVLPLEAPGEAPSCLSQLLGAPGLPGSRLTLACLRGPVPSGGLLEGHLSLV